MDRAQDKAGQRTPNLAHDALMRRIIMRYSQFSVELARQITLKMVKSLHMCLCGRKLRM